MLGGLAFRSLFRDGSRKLGPTTAFNQTVIVSVDDGFLNVDLEVGARTRARLGPLIEALEGKCFELFRGRIGSLYRVHYESSGCHANATATIRALVGAIEALPPPARRAWAAATLREFNIGVELERGVRSVELAIDPETVARVAALGGRIAFTAYQVAAFGKPRRKRAGRRRPAT